jgi:hypothetical protein
MGDARFDDPLRTVLTAPDRVKAIASLDFDELLQALAAASRKGEPMLANVLATAALNRYRRRTALAIATSLGVAAGFALILVVVTVAGFHPQNVPDEIIMLGVFGALGVGALAAWLVHPGILRRILRGRRA